MAIGITKDVNEITSEAAIDLPNEQQIEDAFLKLELFQKVSSSTSSAIKKNFKSMLKSIDTSYEENFNKSKLEFAEYEKNSIVALDKAEDILLNKLIIKMAVLHSDMTKEESTFYKELIPILVEPLKDFENEVDNEKNNLKKKTTKREPFNKSVDDKINQYNNSFDKKNGHFKEGLLKSLSEHTFLADCFKKYLIEKKGFHNKILEHLAKIKQEVKEEINNYPKPIFKVNIAERLRVSHHLRVSLNQYNVSPVISKLTKYILRKNGLNEPALFNASGDQLKIMRLIYEIDSGYLEYIDFNDYHVHDLADVLIRYLKDLPDPILSNTELIKLNNALKSPTNRQIEVSSQIKGIENVLRELDRVKYENLKYLVKYLDYVIKNNNKMKPNLLIKSFIMGIFKINYDFDQLKKELDFGNYDEANNVIFFMISNHDKLLPGDIDFDQYKPLESLDIDDDSEKNNTASFNQTNNTTSKYLGQFYGQNSDDDSDNNIKTSFKPKNKNFNSSSEQEKSPKTNKKKNNNYNELFHADNYYAQFKSPGPIHDSNKLSSKINTHNSDNKNKTSFKLKNEDVNSSSEQKKSPKTNKKNNKNNNQPEEIISHSVMDSDRRYNENSIKKVDNFEN